MNIWKSILLFVPPIFFTLGACGASADQKDLASQQRAQECLNQNCPGDKEPIHDIAEEQIFKRNGRWFVGPKEYGVFDGGLAFYWPSKTPRNTKNIDFLEHNLAASGKAGQAVIEFFVQRGNAKGEMYPGVLDEEQRKNNIANREKLRRGLELITSKPDKIGYWQYYVATDVRTPSGVPALLACRIAATPFCTMGFEWRELPVYVRFDRRNARDWPEIFGETLRILSLIKEVQP